MTKVLWKCECCGHIWGEDEFGYDREGYGICPVCSSEDYEEGFECPRCCEWHPVDMMRGIESVLHGEVFCDDCLAKEMTFENARRYGRAVDSMKISGLFSAFFTEDEIEKILAEKIRATMTDEEIDKEVRWYVTNDDDEFADYLAKEEA